MITALVQLEFWDKVSEIVKCKTFRFFFNVYFKLFIIHQVRDLILSPIRDPKVATTIVLLVIPFFVNVI